MHGAYRQLVQVAALAAVSAFAASAQAHIDLLEPEARAHGTAASGDAQVDQNTNQKASPCGQVTNGRTTDRVTTYAPGETITVRVREETNHTSYYRVWFNPNGDTFPERPLMATNQETLDAARAADQALDMPGDADGELLGVFADNNAANNNEVSFEVTLPDVECNNCTLQVVQFMYGAGQPYYHQCADLVLADGAISPGPDAGAGAGGSSNTSGGGDPLGAGGSSSGGQGGVAGPTAVGGASASGGAAPVGGSSATGNGSAATGGLILPPATDDDEGGCALAPHRSWSPAGWGVLALLALGAARRRKH